MLQWAKSLFGRTAKSTANAHPTINARYENSLTTDENRRNWWAADYYSAKAANNFAVRRTLRIRSRHEVANNPYLFGICNSNADDLISSGPTLQCYTASAEANRQIERAWNEWWNEVKGVEKLRTLKLAKTVDGEGFIVLKTSNSLEHPVKLYPVDIEADQVTTTTPASLMQFWVDGLELDPVTGRPTAYHVLRHHPGDFFFADLNPLKTDRIRADHVIHWFHKFRPGQVRGIPVFTSALDLFTELRAFRKAVLSAAQIAANFAAVLESDAPANTDDDNGEYTPFTTAPIDRGVMATLPAGFRMNQFDPKQPTTSYEQFQEHCLGEACRPLNYPLNLALGTSQKFNFSSAKLDHINYRASLSIEREDCNGVAMEHIFRAWVDEAVMVPGLIPNGITSAEQIRHEWHWPGFQPLDEMAEAQADSVRRNGGQITDQEYFARRGKDWRDVYDQLETEKKERDRRGIKFADSSGKTDQEADAKKVSSAASTKIAAAFDESKHPRGDDGKFGSGGSSEHANSYEPPKAEMESLHKSGSEGDHEAVSKTSDKIVEHHAEHHAESMEKLKQAGASEKQIASVERVAKKQSAEIKKAHSTLNKEAAKVSKAKAKLDEAKAIPAVPEPKEPEYLDHETLSDDQAKELGIGPKPTPPQKPASKADEVMKSKPSAPSADASIEEHEKHEAEMDKWQSEYDAAEAEDEKAAEEWEKQSEAHEKAMDKWSDRAEGVVERANEKMEKEYDRATEKAEAANEKRDEKISDAEDAYNEANDSYSSAHDEFDSALRDANTEITNAIGDVESDLDEVPAK